MIATDMMSFIKSDLLIFGIGVAIVFCLMLYLFFQNTWFVLLPLGNAFITTAFTASVLGLMDWKISVISSNFIALLLILTISLTVHVLVRFTEVSRSSESTDDAIYKTLNQMVRPCLFAALTTSIAFLSLMMGDIKPVIEFGKMMSVGMIFAFIFTFTFLPSAMKLAIKSPSTHSLGLINKIPSSLALIALKQGKQIAIFFLLLAISLIYGISKLEVENRFIDYFSPETEIYQGMLLLDEELGGTATLDILIDQPSYEIFDELDFDGDDLFEDDLFMDDSSEASGYWWNATSLAKLEEIHDYLDDIPEMGKVLSVASGIKLARMINDNNDLNDLELALLRSVLPEDIKETLLYSYINQDDKQKIYIDKLPLNIIYIAEILRIFPNAKFIISLRHPCDCVLSCFMQNFKLNESMSNFLNLKDTAVTYDLIMNLLKIYKSKFDFNFYEIKYEKLILNLNGEIKNLLDFLELQWDNSILEYQKTAVARDRIFTPSYDQVIKPLYSKSSGRWIKYKNKLSNVHPILEPWIREFKYN